MLTTDGMSVYADCRNEVVLIQSCADEEGQSSTDESWLVKSVMIAMVRTIKNWCSHDFRARCQKGAYMSCALSFFATRSRTWWSAQHLMLATDTGSRGVQASSACVFNNYTLYKERLCRQIIKAIRFGLVAVDLSVAGSTSTKGTMSSLDARLLQDRHIEQGPNVIQLGLVASDFAIVVPEGAQNFSKLAGRPKRHS
nr:hypothetical protein CFP56_07727 [Quercus suber]